jgi:hypothetical protein
VDLRHAAVLAVPQRARQRDHVQAELVLRQRHRTFRFRPVGLAVPPAALPFAAPDLQPQPHRPRQRHRRPSVLVALPQIAKAHI